MAQLISNQLKRRVYAYEVGTYFSQQDANHDQHYSGASVKVLPDSLPMYAVPQGLRTQAAAQAVLPRGSVQIIPLAFSLPLRFQIFRDFRKRESVCSTNLHCHMLS